MTKLNLADFRMKLATDDQNKAILLDKLAGRTQATCHDDLDILCGPDDSMKNVG